MSSVPFAHLHFHSCYSLLDSTAKVKPAVKAAADMGMNYLAMTDHAVLFGVRAGEFRYRLIYQYMKQMPIRPIDFDNPENVAKHDKMVGLVERMLELNPKMADENNPETLRLLETQVTATDRLVYDLYNLTEEEIALVEGGSQ